MCNIFRDTCIYNRTHLNCLYHQVCTWQNTVLIVILFSGHAIPSPGVGQIYTRFSGLKAAVQRLSSLGMGNSSLPGTEQNKPEHLFSDLSFTAHRHTIYIA